MVYREERLKESSLYKHADVWSGGSIGGTFQAMESYPEVFEQATDYAIEIPTAFFEDEINSWNGDKLIHAAASYSFTRGVIKVTDRFLDEPSIYTKAGVSFTALSVAGGWKELQFDSQPDPLDMAANYAGWMMAVGHEYRIYKNNDSGEEELDHLNQLLESEDKNSSP